MLEQSLTLTNLTLFGVASILGSGGFNLIGKGVRSGGSWWPLALAGAAILLTGSAFSYAGAYQRFKTNTSESDIIEAEIGVGAAWLGSGAILSYNIVSIVVIMVICSKIIAPTGSWLLQVIISIFMLACMAGLALYGIDVDKYFTDTTTYALIGVLVIAALLGLVGAFIEPKSSPTIASGDFMTSLWMFFYVLIGFDAVMKFTEETKVESDVPTAFYLSNGVSIALTVGVASAIALWLPQLTMETEGNALGLLFAKFFGKGVIGPFRWLIVLFLMLTTFVVFLATSRYIYGVGQKYEDLKPLTAVNDMQAPWVAILSIFGVGAALTAVNHVESLVIITDMGFAVIAALVAASVAAADWRDGEIVSATANSVTTAGFLGLIASAFL